MEQHSVIFHHPSSMSLRSIYILQCIAILEEQFSTLIGNACLCPNKTDEPNVQHNFFVSFFQQINSPYFPPNEYIV